VLSDMSVVISRTEREHHRSTDCVWSYMSVCGLGHCTNNQTEAETVRHRGTLAVENYSRQLFSCVTQLTDICRVNSRLKTLQLIVSETVPCDNLVFKAGIRNLVVET